MMDRTNCTLTDQELTQRAQAMIQKMNLKQKVFALSGNWQVMRDAAVHKRTYNPVPIRSHGCKKVGLSPVAFTDGPRGVVMGSSTCFPAAISRAASFDRELECRIGEAIGCEARAQGANYFAGVCVNALMHPAGGRAQESYGEDPYLLGEMGAQLVRGVQKQNVMACVKHYALNNMENLRFHINVECSERTLREVYLPQFKKCVEAGCASLMGSYNRVRGEQASESRYLLTNILRDEWGFEGFTITDFIFALRDGAKALKAGMDMEMPLPIHFGLELKRAVERGELPEALLDRALLRMIRTVLAFENTPDPRRYDRSLVACEQHIALARTAAEEGMVLIKNEGVLPFAGTVRRVLVVGRLADQPNTGDHGSSRVYPPYVLTPLEGIRRYLGEGAEVLTVAETEIDRAKALAESCDAVVFVVGNDYNDEGEFVVPDQELDSAALMGQGFANNGHPLLGRMMRSAAGKTGQGASYTSDDGHPVGGDRKSLSLRAGEIEAIRALKGINPNTVVVLVCGSMILTREWEDAAPAILYSFYSGMEGGTALARILWGQVNPSARLPFTIPTDERHLPQVDFFHADTIRYEYDHGYRKLDRDGNCPAYPFGFGLSYTTFQYGKAAVTVREQALEVSVRVRNTGERAGTEVVQVYLAYPESQVERHVKELKGFERVALLPGEEKTCIISIPFEEMKYYDETTGSWVLEKGPVDVLVGPCADADALETVRTEIL